MVASQVAWGTSTFETFVGVRRDATLWRVKVRRAVTVTAFVQVVGLPLKHTFATSLSVGTQVSMFPTVTSAAKPTASTDLPISIPALKVALPVNVMSHLLSIDVPAPWHRAMPGSLGSPNVLAVSDSSRLLYRQQSSS